MESFPMGNMDGRNRATAMRIWDSLGKDAERMTATWAHSCVAKKRSKGRAATLRSAEILDFDELRLIKAESAGEGCIDHADDE